MPVFPLLLLLFITVPLLELYVLIRVGREIGALSTIALCVLTAVLGATLIRLQGLATVARVQAALNENRLPAVDLVAGAMLLLTAFLLLTPGFVTDLLGFVILVPAVRNALARRVIGSARIHGGPGDGHGGGPGGEGVEVVIEGEYRETRTDAGEEPRELPPRGPPA